MRIVMLLSNPFRPDPRVLKEAVSLVQWGYDVTVICWDRTSELAAEETVGLNIHIIRIQNVRSGYGIGIRQLFRLPLFWLSTFPILNHLEPDFVHCHDFDTLPAGLLWSLFHFRPVIYDAHEHYAELCKPRLKGIIGKFTYWFLNIAERICTLTTSAVVTVDKRLGSIYRRSNQKVVIIGHYPNRILATKTTPIFGHSELVLIYIGRLSVDRGLLIYVDMLRNLREQGIPARLKLAGTFTPPNEKQRLIERCQGLENELDILGWIHYSQVPALLRTADVGLAILQPEPRYVKALPVKLFEYMAAGLPVVASNFPSIADIMNDIQCGTLVEPQDVQAAVEQIRYWWEHPDEVRKIGERGRQAVLEKFNWETSVGQLGSLYGSLATKERSP
jgi:glycosyltransferase involved in cell wall biosynthesis